MKKIEKIDISNAIINTVEYTIEPICGAPIKGGIN